MNENASKPSKHFPTGLLSSAFLHEASLAPGNNLNIQSKYFSGAGRWHLGEQADSPARGEARHLLTRMDPMWVPHRRRGDEETATGLEESEGRFPGRALHLFSASIQRHRAFDSEYPGGRGLLVFSHLTRARLCWKNSSMVCFPNEGLALCFPDANCPPRIPISCYQVWKRHSSFQSSLYPAYLSDIFEDGLKKF